MKSSFSFKLVKESFLKVMPWACPGRMSRVSVGEKVGVERACLCNFPNGCDTHCVFRRKPGGRMFVSKGGGEGCECCIYPCPLPPPPPGHGITKESFVLDNTRTELH